MSSIRYGLSLTDAGSRVTRYPKYIHVLKVNPKSAASTIEKSALWALTEGKDDDGDSPDPNEV